MKKKQLGYRFYLEVPIWMQVTGPIFELCSKLDMPVELVGEERGILRKTVIFLAKARDKNQIALLQKHLKKGLDDYEAI